MFPIKPSKRILIGLVIISAILFLGMGFGYWSMATKLHKLHVEVAKKQEALANSEQTARRVDVVREEYSNAVAQLRFLEQGVSTKAYIPTLLRQVEELGRDVNLRVVGVRPQVAQEKPALPPGGEETKKAPKVAPKPEPYDKLDIDLEIQGKYWDVASFLYRITSFPKIIAVRSIQASPVSQMETGSGSPILSVKLSTRAYILKDHLNGSPAHVEQVKTPVRRA